jgi:hypothetical protein
MNYTVLIHAIDTASARLQGKVAGVANQSLVLRNWLVNSWIIEFEQNGKDRAKYGAPLLEKLAADLGSKGLRGLGLTSLKMCCLFARAYPEIRQTLSNESASSTSQTGQVVPLAAAQLLRLSWRPTATGSTPRSEIPRRSHDAPPNLQDQLVRNSHPTCFHRNCAAKSTTSCPPDSPTRSSPSSEKF